MKKIPTIFVRDFSQKGAPITREWHADCLWIRDGGGIATIKWDGTCCLIQGGTLFKRLDCKRGKVPPAGFVPAMEPDPITGHHCGWVAVGDGPDDQWHREAWAGNSHQFKNRTYELCGPKINGNPYGAIAHALIPHGENIIAAPCEYDALAEWFKGQEIEGIVWHGLDGRMAKIKRRDFGLEWPVKK